MHSLIFEAIDYYFIQPIHIQMCGRLNITDHPGIIALCEQLGIKLKQSDDERGTTFTTMPNGQAIPFSRFIRATQPVAIIREVAGQRVIKPATWWLLLDNTEGGWKPSKYTSFNTRYDKLNVPRSAGYIPFRESRCIIPVTGFGETQGSGTSARYVDFTADKGALALGGLCKDYLNKQTGEVTTAFSVITLPPHPKLTSFYSKSCPLMLPQNTMMDRWLDSTNNNVVEFDELLLPTLYQDLQAVYIDKPSTHRPLAKPVSVAKD